jgi:hypothetical protein
MPAKIIHSQFLDSPARILSQQLRFKRRREDFGQDALLWYFLNAKQAKHIFDLILKLLINELSDNPFNPSANKVACIENLNDFEVVCAPV